MWGIILNTTNVLSTYDIKEEDQLRADMYSFIANLIRSEPSVELIETIKNLKGDKSNIGSAIKLLSKFLS